MEDRFGNEHAAGLPYARGAIIRSTEDDIAKLRRAGRVIDGIVRARGLEAVFNFTGLERSLPLTPEELAVADDEIAPAIYGDRFRAAALAHLGGTPGRHPAAGRRSPGWRRLPGPATPRRTSTGRTRWGRSRSRQR